MGTGPARTGDMLVVVKPKSGPYRGPVGALVVCSGAIEYIGGMYSSDLSLKGFSGNKRSSTLGPKVLGLLLGRETETICPGSDETSIGGGIRGAGYGGS